MERMVKEIAELDVRILDELLDADCTDEEYASERATIEEYEDKFHEMRLKVNSVLMRSRPSSPSGKSIASTTQKRRTFKLPEIELLKYNGDLKEWLGFWSQFQKIHEDDDIDPSDKFQYLLQAMEKGSRARDLVESYPQTAENYPKVIVALQNRFGKEELLVEVYVRELLKLVISNVSHTKEKVSLSSMYDKLESHLRALESLGVTIDKYASMLYPMVESSLPETILVAWQRSPLSSRDGSTETPSKSRLCYLMEFLRSEVEGEERVALARTGFLVTAGKGKPKTNKDNRDSVMLPTAAGLFSGTGNSKQTQCIFCDKPHESKECFKAQTMTLFDKRVLLKNKKCCYVCLRTNHLARACKASVRCQVCRRRHYTLMCPDLPCHKEQKTTSHNEAPDDRPSTDQEDQKVPDVQHTLSNQSCTKDVLLQTLTVKILGKNKQRNARALIDTGSQRSYILKRTAKEMGCESVSEETIIHSLFGGMTSGQQQHRKYTVLLKHLNQPSSILLEVLDQDRICGDIPRVDSGPWTKQLKENGIWLSDFGPGCPPVELLIGADVFGRLLTGKVYQLGSDLTAVETTLGWTVTGQSPCRNQGNNLSMTVTTMLIQDAVIADLWKLETIGISDPVESKSKEEAEEESWQRFQNTVT